MGCQPQAVGENQEPLQHPPRYGEGDAMRPLRVPEADECVSVATIKSTSESAIKYLRKNLKVVATLKGMERDKLIEKMQKRYNYAVSDGQSISAELTERLREVGVSVIEH